MARTTGGSGGWFQGTNRGTTDRGCLTVRLALLKGCYASAEATRDALLAV
jgi:hypothetical protein